MACRPTPIVLCETPAMAIERIRHFATIKDLLTADTLGTS